MSTEGKGITMSMSTETEKPLRPLWKTTLDTSHIEIVEVTNKKQLKTFVQLPRKLYPEKTSRYVMPLEAHVSMMMGKLGTPQKHFFLAMKNGVPVGRLGVKVHT